MKKQIAGALAAVLLMTSVPGWAEEKAAAAPVKAEATAETKLQASIDRAIALSAPEREDLATRHAALRTDPVASGAGGIVLSLIATAASIGLTLYLLKKTKEELPPPTMARR